VNALSCDFSGNGFTATTSYVVGLGGEDLTEFDLAERAVGVVALGCIRRATSCHILGQ
jgi:hypothetical protein